MQTTSTKNLRIRSSSLNNNNSPNRPTSPQKKFQHKKQIQATLNQLHQLQSQIYSLNVPEFPHSSGPTKKEIKQLSYLYENMTSKFIYQEEPKVKNNLSIQMKDIKSALQIMNEGMGAIDEKANPYKAAQSRKLQKSQIQEISLLREFAPVVHQVSQPETSLKISSKSLKQIMKKIYNNDFDLSLVSETRTARVTEITADEIEKFINYNEFGNFDPLKQAYNCLLDENGKFSFKKYNEINEIFGLPKVKQLGLLKQAVGAKQNESISFQKFKQIMEEGTQIGFA